MRPVPPAGQTANSIICLTLSPQDILAANYSQRRSAGLFTSHSPRFSTCAEFIVALVSLCTRSSNPQPRRPASQSACQRSARSARYTSNKISAPALRSSNLLFRSKFQLLPTRLAPVAAAIFAGEPLLLRSRAKDLCPLPALKNDLITAGKDLKWLLDLVEVVELR